MVFTTNPDSLELLPALVKSFFYKENYYNRDQTKNIKRKNQESTFKLFNLKNN